VPEAVVTGRQDLGTLRRAKHMLMLCKQNKERFLHLKAFTDLVLDKKLDTLDGSGGGLRDSGGNTTH